MSVRALLLVVCLSAPLLAQQQRVDLRNMYERLLCVVPMVGSGTADDPQRPAHAPLPSVAGAPLSRDGIIAYTFQVSDDDDVHVHDCSS